LTIFKQMQADELKADLEQSGIRVVPESEMPTEGGSVWKNWTPEQRRCFRLLEARDAIRGAVGNLDAFGGPLTTEELATARAILAGKIKAGMHVTEDCDGVSHRNLLESKPKDWSTRE